jgi:RHS repeat-associated protein
MTQAGHTGGNALAAYTYNNKAELSTEVLNPNGSAQTRTFGYNNQAVLTSISNSLFTESMTTTNVYHGLYASVQTSYGSFSPTPPQYTYSFTYDRYGRLKAADNNNYNNWDIGVTNPTTYDSSGNITQLQRASAGSKQYSYKAGTNIPETVGDWSFSSDVTGNITGSGSSGTVNTYDPFTQLVMRIVKGGTTDSLQYDGRKECVYKKMDSIQTLFLHGLNDYPLMIKSGGDEYLYVYGIGGIVAMRANGTWYYVMRDHLGSTRLIVSSSGEVVCRYDYDPYGKILDVSQNVDPRYKFTGQALEKDISASSFWNFRARMYDSDVALFYAADPAHETYSRYGYCAGNPISFVDPTGRMKAPTRYEQSMAGIINSGGMNPYDYGNTSGNWSGGGTGFTDASGAEDWYISFEEEVKKTWGQAGLWTLIDQGWKPDPAKNHFTGPNAMDRAAVNGLLYIMFTEGRDALREREYGGVVVEAPYFDGTAYSYSTEILVASSGNTENINYIDYENLATKMGGRFAAIYHTHTHKEDFTYTSRDNYGDNWGTTFGNTNKGNSVQGPGTIYLLTPSGDVRKWQFDSSTYYDTYYKHRNEDGYSYFDAFVESQFRMASTVDWRSLDIR